MHRKVGNGRAVPDELGSQAWCTVVTRRQKESPGRETIYIDGHRGGLIVSKRGKASPPTLPTIGRLLGLATTPVFRETYADQLSEFVSDAAGGRPAILIITAPGNEVFIVRHTHTNTHTGLSSFCYFSGNAERDHGVARSFTRFTLRRGAAVAGVQEAGGGLASEG